MSCVIKTCQNPLTKKTVREAILSKEMVCIIADKEFLDVTGWLFGDYHMLRFILNKSEYESEFEWDDELQKIYRRYQRAKTDATRHKNLEILVDMIYARIRGVFTRSGRKKYVAAWKEEQTKRPFMADEKMIKDLQALIFAPLWKKMK